MKYIILGLIQGLTEFLPVSSSGHLVIFQKLLNVPYSIAFDVAVHLATLLAVMVFFWRDIIEILRWLGVGLFKIATRKENLIEVYDRILYFRLACLLLFGFLITAVIGLSFSDVFESFFSSTKAVGAFLILTGAIIYIAERFPKGKREMNQLNIWDSIIIGLAQAAAIAPGLSRSGATISAGLMRGLDRELAARFSFLLAIPAILAAGVFEARKIYEAPEILPLILGAISAFASGYLTIGIFMGLITRQSIRGFAYYCAAIGIIALILL